MEKSKYSRVFIYIFWILLFVVGYYGFNFYIESQNNPNQKPTVSIGKEGQYIVYLHANQNHSYFANGLINNYPVKFLVDTGATSVVVPYSIAQKIGLKKGYPYRAKTANGTITVYSTKIDNLSIGNISLSNINASINDSEKGNVILLGMSALKHLEINYKNNMMILTQNNYR
jgi:aspartyl protease family protein